MEVKEAGVGGDIKAVGLSNWKNEWRCLSVMGVMAGRAGVDRWFSGDIFRLIHSLNMSSRQLDRWVWKRGPGCRYEFIFMHTHTIKPSALVSVVTLLKTL